MEWRIIVGAAVLGILALVLSFLSDRRARRRREEALLPPHRDIPRLSGADAPTYISAEQANTAPAGEAATLTEKEQARLSAARQEPHLSSGWADPRFVTHRAQGWAVLHDPLVVVVDEIGSVRELLPLLERAVTSDCPLVIVAGKVEADTLDTLAVNVLQRNRDALLVIHPARELRAAAVALGVDVVDRTALQAGWCPSGVFAQVGDWVSDKTSSWYVR